MHLDTWPSARVEEEASGHDDRTRRWAVAVAGATLIALGLRFAAIERHSLWYDEAVTANLIGSSYFDIYFGNAKDLGCPPLNLLLTRAWSSLFGRSEVGLRSLPALLGTLTVPLLALLGRRLLSPTAGLIAAGLLAISPMAIELSDEARAYALLAFLAVLNTWLFVRWAERGRSADLAAYAVTMALAWSSHYYAVALPLAHAVSLAAMPGRRRWLPWLGAMAVAALIWSPWLPAFVDQLRTPDNIGRGGERWYFQFLATPLVFALGRTLAWRDSPWWVLGLATLGAVTAFWIPALWGLACLRRRPFAGSLLAAWLAAPTVGPLVVALLLTPIYATRYAVVGLPAFLLLLGWGLERLPARARSALIALILALTAISLARYATLPLKDDWRTVTPDILASVQAGEPVLFDADHQIIPFLYYVPRVGPPPTTMFGLTSGPSTHGTLSGVRYRDGRKLEHRSHDHTGEILSARAVWLVLCQPMGSQDDYEAYFRDRGYRKSAESHFHRIDVLKFSAN